MNSLYSLQPCRRKDKLKERIEAIYEVNGRDREMSNPQHVQESRAELFYGRQVLPRRSRRQLKHNIRI
jgi:hypothetical protein